MTSSDLAAIEAHARADYPREACGLLIADTARPMAVTTVVATPNRAEDPLSGFEIDPQTHIDWQRRLRGGPASIIGCYHSHPRGGTHPSAVDRLAARQPGFVWIISAVSAAGTVSSRIWRATGTGDFTPVHLEEIVDAGY